MALYVSEQWLKDYCARTGQKVPTDGARQEAEHAPRKKYGNQTTEKDGRRFDSKHEAAVYELLRMECLAGKHVGLACQVAFYLPGGVKYIADFVTNEADGTYTVYDAKSEATRKDKTYRLKKRQMKNCLGIDIQEV